MQSSAVDPQKPYRTSGLVHIGLIGLVILILQIPGALISGLIEEREQRRDSVVEEIGERWGPQQQVAGPILAVPWVQHWVGSDGTTVSQESHLAMFVPDRLTLDGTLQSETRTRGIFDVPVYTGHLVAEGDFSAPELEAWDDPNAEVDWEHARLVVFIGDPRRVARAPLAQWDEREVTVAPGTGDGERPGLSIPLGAQAKGGGKFSFALDLNGTGALDLATLGDTTEVTLRGDWPHPSFAGARLPASRSVTEDGFQAKWQTSKITRGFESKWDGASQPSFEGTLVGLSLFTPVDHYRMAHRSVKYDLLFLTLVFAVLSCFEASVGVRVHPIQYALTGAAVCLFYLLQLALSEHVGFPLAYTVASALIVAMIGLYARSLLDASARAGIVAATTGATLCFFYVLLMNEDASLLIGSIGLFVALGAVMHLTRKVDWNSLMRSDRAKPGATMGGSGPTPAAPAGNPSVAAAQQSTETAR